MNDMSLQWSDSVVPKYALLAPIPFNHLQGALRLLTEKDFVLFGSGAYDVFASVEAGVEVLVYVSHDTANPVATYRGVYRGLVDRPLDMRRLEKAGFRPMTTAGEKWPFFWKLSDIEKLASPYPLSNIRLPSGGYLNGYPRGPMQIVN